VTAKAIVKTRFLLAPPPSQFPTTLNYQACPLGDVKYFVSAGTLISTERLINGDEYPSRSRNGSIYCCKWSCIKSMLYCITGLYNV